MLDVGWSELLIIGVVALVVVGPKDLPKLLRVVGQTVGKIRRMAAEFQGQVNEAIREAELDDVKKSVEELKSYNPATMIRNEIDSAMAPVTRISGEIDAEMNRIEAGIDAPPAATPSASEPASVPEPSADTLGLPEIAPPEPPRFDVEPAPVETPEPDASVPPTAPKNA